MLPGAWSRPVQGVQKPGLFFARWGGRRRNTLAPAAARDRCAPQPFSCRCITHRPPAHSETKLAAAVGCLPTGLLATGILMASPSAWPSRQAHNRLPAFAGVASSPDANMQCCDRTCSRLYTTTHHPRGWCRATHQGPLFAWPSMAPTARPFCASDPCVPRHPADCTNTQPAMYHLPAGLLSVPPRVLEAP